MLLLPLAASRESSNLYLSSTSVAASIVCCSIQANLHSYKVRRCIYTYLLLLHAIRRLIVEQRRRKILETRVSQDLGKAKKPPHPIIIVQKKMRQTIANYSAQTFSGAKKERAFIHSQLLQQIAAQRRLQIPTTTAPKKNGAKKSSQMKLLLPKNVTQAKGHPFNNLLFHNDW